MDAHPRLAEWRSWLDPADRLLYEQAGFRSPSAPVRARSALLVIDVVRRFVGSRPAPVREAIREYPTSCGERAWAALPMIARLLDAFRAVGAPVVFTRADRAAQVAIGRATTRAGGGPGDGGSEAFVAGIEPGADEWVCEKARASAFYGTPLESFLRARGVAAVAVCGGTTSGCVRASCVDAFSAGFSVVVAEDACFDRARQPHLANLFDLGVKYAAVLSAAEVAERLELGQ
jgi:maleamate amidohydrolase